MTSLPPPSRDSTDVVATHTGRGQATTAVLLLACMVAVAFGNSLQGPFVFDDLPTIAQNESIRDLFRPLKVLSPPPESTAGGRPVLNLSFAVNYDLGGLNPLGYHLTNVAIHFLAAAALFGIIRQTLLLRGVAAGRATSLAVVASMIWAVHPLQTESVSYISQRAESLAGALYLATFFCVIRSAASGGRRKALWEVVAIAACAAGMASKETVATAPPLLFLFDRIFLAPTFRDVWRRRWHLYVTLLATYGLLFGLVLSTGRRNDTVGFGLAISPMEYLATQCWAICHYLCLTFWPHDLVFDYGSATIDDMAKILPAAGALCLLLALTAVALVRFPACGFLGLAFFVLLAPSSSIVPIVSQTVAEHRMYLPLAPVVILVIVVCDRVCRAIIALPLARRCVAATLAVGTVASLTYATVTRNVDYQDPTRLWSTVVARAPTNARGHNFLGFVLSAGGFSAALPHFQQAVRLSPADVEMRYNLAAALRSVGRPADAESQFREVLRLKPDYLHAYTGLAAALAAQGRLSGSEAFELADEASRAFEPQRATALFATLAEIYAAAARFDIAASLAKRALDCGDIEAMGPMSYELSKRLATYNERSRRIPTVDAPAAPAGGDGERYSGSQTCADCHVALYESYLKTAHSQSFSNVGAAREPPDAEFGHPLSGRQYRVYRDEGRLRHLEWRSDAPDEMRSDHAPKYVVGSGRHARTYVIEDSGFLAESPLTWYAGRGAWDLSPGFDKPTHWGFERGIEIACLTCHVGRSEVEAASPTRIRIHEQAIGCERCHGPGSQHVLAEREPRLRDELAQTIVNPAKLPRDLQEAICAQCHLRGAAAAHRSGKTPLDFRPGRPITDIRIDYQADNQGVMTAVGHFEQMRASRCYQASGSLSCTSCHDPHASPSADVKLAYFRSRCLKCHAETACELTSDQRLARAADDNCAACHMPRLETDVPHVALTDHRIARESKRPTVQASRQTAELSPLERLRELSNSERDRCLGLAFVELWQEEINSPSSDAYGDRAIELLGRVQSQETRGGEVNSALARLFWARSPVRATDHAWTVLSLHSFTSGAQLDPLFVAADDYCRQRKWEFAKIELERLTSLRRRADDWRLLGVCHAELRDWPMAVIILKRALAINPFRPDVHESLARVFEAMGNQTGAARHRELARILSHQESPVREPAGTDAR